MAVTKLPFLPPPILPSIFLFLFLSSAPIITAAVGSCNAGDKIALSAIKGTFQAAGQLGTWTDATACCDWSGVACDAGSGRVYALRIYDSAALSGSIPSAISNLPFLTELLLFNLPLLTGPIPLFLTALPRLLTLTLRNNSLSGPIPSFLSQLRSLDDLDLSYNKFTGSIPAELSLLVGLSHLSLSNNLLTGGVPAAFGRFSVDKPPQLDLSNNQLSGQLPTELGTLSWNIVDLSNNKFVGDASMFFGPGKALTKINLSGNQFGFNLSGISFPLGLTILYLDHNEISGSIPAQLNNLTHLNWLNLSYNSLCGEIPAGPLNRFGKEAFEGNPCLCGAPLAACS